MSLPSALFTVAFWRRHATWGNALRLAVIMTGWRLAFVAIAPFELSGDEAHYWEWSRHLELSYYTKGPGVALAIAAGTALFGDTEFGVRIVSVLCGLITAWALGRLAMEAWGCERAGFLTVLAHSSLPLFQAMGILMTIDGPLLALSALAGLVGWRLLADGGGRRKALLLGALIGGAFLFKYTALLVLLGWLAASRVTGSDHRAGTGSRLLVIASFLLVTTPVWLWNVQEGFPALTHLLGHLGVKGGDQAPTPLRPHETIPEALLVQTLAFGPIALLVLLVLRSGGQGLRPSRGRSLSERYARAPAAFRHLLALAAPTALLYAGIAPFTRIQANWPLLAWAFLLPAVGGVLARGLDHVEASPGSPPTRAAARWTGSIAAFGALLVFLLSLLPLGLLSEELARRAPWRRVHGEQRRAAMVQEARKELARRTGRKPLIVGNRYDTTSLLAFYLPDQPTVYSAATDLGGRPSAYSWFEETDLAAALAEAPPAVLVRGDPERWRRAFATEDFTAFDRELGVYTVEHLRASEGGGGRR